MMKRSVMMGGAEVVDQAGGAHATQHRVVFDQMVRTRKRSRQCRSTTSGTGAGNQDSRGMG